MKINWTQGLSPEDKATMETLVKNSTIVLNRLESIVKEWDAGAEKASISPKNFDNVNWAYAQAYVLGQRQAYKQVTELLDQKVN